MRRRAGTTTRHRALSLLASIALVVPVALADHAGAAGDETPARGRAYPGVEPERVVAGTLRYPARAVGTLDVTLHGTPRRCTAFLVDANSVVTAAHCIHDGSGDTGAAWASSATFQAGHDAGAAPWGTCAATDGHAPWGWRTEADERVDYAVVQLDCDIGVRVGWFGLWLSGRGGDLRNQKVYVRGYPDDLAGSQWRGGGRVTGLTPRLVFANARTNGGVDGAPTYFSSAACGGPCAVAVSSTEPHGGAGVHAATPHGPRFTLGRFQQILAWAAENG
ncbi:MAG: trypsin-like peptidase domain-containing protein [Acidimicrobiales bacterium]|nr:trypsin-like peptidase domain-containing protein [Acidimicrobiales bacterium]MCB9372463.1 trypsin-like peptidase domain-containing protein [Microthrixaceae bacterium]